MAMMKFQVGDGTPEQKRRRVSSTGAHGNSDNSKSRKYANSGVANTPITKAAQFAGTGANVVFTQPMFFSPLHTPQNWQIASKRREIYQWSFINPCNITKSDMSIVNLASLANPTSSYIRGTSSYIANLEGEDKIELLDGEGNLAFADVVSSHNVSKKANKITVTGTTEPLVVTEDHDCIVIRKEDVKCVKGHKSKNCIFKQNSPTCERYKCDRYENVDYKISKVKAKDVSVGDYFLVPFPTEVRESVIDTEEKARFAGHLASDGSLSSHGSRICFNEDEKEYVYDTISNVYSDFGGTGEATDVSTIKEVRCSNSLSFKFASSIIADKRENKKFTDQVVYLDPSLQKHVLGAYLQSDGTYNKQNDVYEITTYSPHLANQLLIMFYRCGILARGNKQPISKSKGTFKTNNTHRYIINIPSSECDKISEYVPGKSKDVNVRKKGSSWRFFWKNNVVSRVRKNEQFDYEGPVYDIRVPPTYTVAVNGVAVHQCRFYYENEPRVAAGVDFYSYFPLNGFKLECKDRRILEYYEQVVEDLELNEWLNYISFDYHLLGEVFPFLEIDCSNCGGKGVTEDGEPCNHPDGTFRSIRVLNPDYVEVQANVLADETLIAMRPDEELQMIVQRRQPKQIFDKLDPRLIELVATQQPIPLSNRSVSHLRHNTSGYSTYGSSPLRRLFTVLAYKTKIMTANWIVAERMILPVRVVKVGDKDRPASEEDIQDVVNQLAAVVNDPNLTIVTHHAFCYDEETEVLTDEGWKKYYDLHHDEQIMVFDPNTEECYYEKPLDYYEFNVKGPMFKIEGNKLDMMVTPNHRMLNYDRKNKNWTVKTATELADSSECDRYVRSVANYVAEDIEEIDLCGNTVPINEFLQYVGYYLSEGYTIYNEEKRQYNVSVSQCPKTNAAICNSIDNTMVDTGLKFSRYEYDYAATSWNILNKDIANQMKSWFGTNSYDKKIPSFIKNLPPSRLKYLIQAYLDGDASCQEYSIGTYTQSGTNSKQLADDLMEIMFKAGYAPTIARNRKEEQQYVINCSLSKQAKGRFSRIKDEHIDEVQYEGKVWCFKTSTGFFVTRRNGRVAIQGNSYDWYGACYDKDTEILTSSGWKTFDKLNKEELVATYNADEGLMEYEKPLEYHEYDYDSDVFGGMYSFKAKSIDINVTPNHRMLIERNGKLQEVYSQDVKHDDKLLSTTNWDGEVPENLPYKNSPLSHLSLDEYLKFVGYYISEGGAKEERNKNLKEDKIIQACSISQSSNSDSYNDIKELVSVTYPSYSIYYDSRNNGCNSFVINSVEIARYLAEEFGTHSCDKRIPEWIRNLPKDKIQIIYKAMMAGDGDTRLDGIKPRHRYTTVSKQLSDDFSDICLKLGYWPSVKEEDNRNKYPNRKVIYRVYWSECREDVKFNLRNQHITRKDYVGKVYCVKVPNSWVFVRRNGNIVICGNTGKIHNISNDLELIGKELLDGLMLNQALLNGEMAGYSCYDENTLCLTDSGFKKYEDITEEDKIGCYNKESGELEYHNYLDRYEYDFEGELIHFQTDKIDISVTENHRMFAAKRDSDEFDIIEAKDVKRRSRFIGAIDENKFNGEDTDVVNIGDISIPIYEYCELAGFYVSEGCISDEKRPNRINGPSTVNISQSVNGKARKNISTLFDSCFNTHYESYNSVSVYGMGLAKHFEEEYGRGSESKRLPSWLKNLSSEYLEIIINAMLLGDGNTKEYKDRSVDNHAYYTSSKKLAYDFAEIAFKSGYVTKISKIKKNKNKKRYFNKSGHEYIAKLQQYCVYISKGFKGRKPVLDSRSNKYKGREIEKVNYSGKVWCFSVPHGLFVTMRNGKIAIQGNSAQVGVEVLLHRLENWRNRLKNWVEKKIFLPIAMMKGFVDEEKTKRTGRVSYLYPKLKWNELNLRDKTNKVQLLLQMYDKQLVSAQSILEELDLDYDSEVEKIREEQVMASAGGMLQPGMPGGQMGGGGPLGGAPVGGPGGGVPGGEMGGMPGAPGAEMGGMPGAPGGDMGVGMAGGPEAGGMGAAASDQIPKVTKRGKGADSGEEQQVAPPQLIKMTKLEAKMYKGLQQLNVPYNLFGQYQVNLPGQKQPFVLDFAYPQLGVGVECLHPDTLVQTSDGSIKAKDITLGKKLIGRNGEKVDIKRIIVNENVEDMVKIKPFGLLDIEITKNHPLLVCKPKKDREYRNENYQPRWRPITVNGNPEFIEAKDVNEKDYLVIPKRRYLGEKIDRIDMSKYSGSANNRHKDIGLVDFDEDLAWLFGIYAAEGCSSHRAGKGIVVTFSLNILETDIADKIERIIKDKFDLPCSRYLSTENNCMRVTVCCTQLGRFFRDKFGHLAHNKKLAEFMFRTSDSCKEQFLKAFCKGDGCVRPESNIHRHQSSSKSMLIDMQQLSMSIGKFSTLCISRREGVKCSFYRNNNETVHETKGLWELTINWDESKRKVYREDDFNFYVPIMKIENVKYTGPVFNFETIGSNENNHTFLAGNVVTHNCDGAIWHQREDLQARDNARDEKLASVGWRILRFTEEAVESHIDTVIDVIKKNLLEAYKERKKASENNSLEKYASAKNNILNSKKAEELLFNIEDIEEGLGYIISIEE